MFQKNKIKISNEELYCVNKSKKYFIISLVVLSIVLFVSFFCTIFLGSADINVGDVIKVLKLKLFSSNNVDVKKSVVSIVWGLRIPRGLLALAIGGALSVSGSAMQALTRNVLADPYILGVSSGALLFVSICYLIGGFFVSNSWIVSIMAFLGAIFSLVLIYIIGNVKRGGSSTRLILSGMAISITLNAISNFFIFITPMESRLRSIYGWTLGGVSTARWSNLPVIFISLIIGSFVFLRYARAYDLMSLGDETAITLGVNVNKIRTITIILVALVSGVSVAGGGLIGLVGFIIPHIVRHFVGTNHKKLISLSFLVGGIFLLWMDVLARTLMAPEEVPIGLFTAICGGPFFIWILRKEERR